MISGTTNSITMKLLLLLFLLLLLGPVLKGQTAGGANEGNVSYVTSQNVYVKFGSTEGISAGDTLFTLKDTKMIPVLIVKELSSISCVCVPVSSAKLSVNDKIRVRQRIAKPVENKEIAVVAEVKPLVVNSTDTVQSQIEPPVELKQSTSGRISISSYSNFSNVSDFSQRMRYTFSMNVQNISASKFSAETYISFVHKMNEWSEVQEDIFNGLKIYSLSVNYAFNKNNTIWLGRKINPRLSNVGAIDGLQYEMKLKSFTFGAFAGSRPDYMNYSFNPGLLQYGGYFSHDYLKKNGGNAQSSLAIVEQKNNGYTDRRFAYLQHSNSLLPKLYFFGSIEFDLYNKVLNTQDSSYTQDNSPNLSNMYFSLRYKVIKQLSVSVSYSERQNIIYYETYKSIIDQLLEEATMRGFMFQMNYRPIKNLTLGANAGYRYSKKDPRPSKNLYAYATYSSVPWINASATLSATLLESAYVSGSIYSLGLSRDVIPGKLYGGVSYRYVNYKFPSAETPLIQNMGELNLTWRIMKKLSFSFNYEGTFEKGRNYDRIYINLTQRF
jgi:hypothetical protein